MLITANRKRNINIFIDDTTQGHFALKKGNSFVQEKFHSFKDAMVFIYVKIKISVLYVHINYLVP